MVKFVIDSNALIDSFNLYYKNNVFPTVWNFIAKHIISGDFIIIDKVFNELEQQDDSLKDWMEKNIDKQKILNVDQLNIMDEYINVQNFIINSNYWKPAGYNAWSGSEKADPWLIATAMHFENYIIITHERSRPKMDKNRPSKKEPKITTVAENFNIETLRMYELLEKLKFSV